MAGFGAKIWNTLWNRQSNNGGNGVGNNGSNDHYVFDGIENIGEKFIDLYKTFATTELDIAKAHYDAQIQLVQSNLQVLTTKINKSLSAGLSILTKTANEAAYASGQAVEEMGKAQIKANIQQETIRRRASVAVARAEYDRLEKVVDLISQTGQYASNIIRSFGDNSNSGIANMLTDAVGGTAHAIAKLGPQLYMMEQKLQLEYMEFQTEQYEKAGEIIGQLLDTMGGYISEFRKLTQDVDKFIGEFDTATHKLAVTMGYVGTQGEAFAASYRNASIEIAKTFGVSMKEIQQLQSSYIEASGRAVNLSVDDMNTTLSTARLFGIDNNTAAQLYGDMNVFNTSVESGGEMMEHMYKTVTKMGLSTSKFAKDLSNNLKLAQKYNFKGGLDNMMKMTQWAQQTRFNLNNAVSFADKIMGGSLSDALETSAKLQVLGGASAIYSDPLGMLYDAGADVGSLAQRQAAMFSDITGTFNEKTGETELNWYENRMLAARAQAAGISIEDARNQVRQSQKQARINEELSGMDVSDEVRTAIGNRATYDTESQSWVLTDINGNKHSIEEVANDKTGNLLKNILPEDNDEAMLEIAKKSLAVEEQMANQQQEIIATLGNDQFSDYTENAQERMRIQQETYLENKENIGKIAEQLRAFDTESMSVVKNNLDMLVGEKGLEAMNSYFGAMQANATLTQGKLDSLATDLNDLNTKGPDGFARAYIDKQMAFINSGNANTVSTSIGNTASSAGVKSPSANDIMSSVQTTAANVGSYLVNTAKSWFGISDGIVAQNGKVTKIDSGDNILAAKNGGPIDKLLTQLLPMLQQPVAQNNSSTMTMKHELSGTLNLTQNGSTVNLVDLLKNNPAVATQLISILARAMEINDNGKPIKNYMV